VFQDLITVFTEVSGGDDNNKNNNNNNNNNLLEQLQAAPETLYIKVRQNMLLKWLLEN
jgi:hypothetical protein